MLSDDELRRIAADRLLPLVGDRLNTANGEKFIGNMRSDWGDMVGAFAAILREEFEALAEKIRSQNWVQEDGELIADPFATVVHTTDY